VAEATPDPVKSTIQARDGKMAVDSLGRKYHDINNDGTYQTSEWIWQ
jgi:hypothetical protein